MMRKFALVSFLVLAACSDNVGADENANGATDEASLALASGQWETTTEITEVTSRDGGTPVLKVAEKSVVSTCVAEGEGRKPTPAVLAGMEECSYDTIYMSRGRVTASLSCTKPGHSGKFLVSTEGTYTADAFDTSAQIETSLSGDGDVRAQARITGRRTGDCTAQEPTA